MWNIAHYNYIILPLQKRKRKPKGTKSEKSKSKSKNALNAIMESGSLVTNCHNVGVVLDSSQMDVNDGEFLRLFIPCACLTSDVCFLFVPRSPGQI